jgi:hypothetical protein
MSDLTRMSRRTLLQAASGAVGAAWLGTAWAGYERPEVTRPRATSGDTAVEPEWEQRLTVTVGPRDADIAGETDRALQAAVDYVSRLGGGTVKVLPGTYRLRNAVYLPSGVRVVGSGPESVLVKEPSVATMLAEHSDWFDGEITLADAKGFEVGDGVCLETTRPDVGGAVVLRRTLVARSGNRFKLDKPLRENCWMLGDGTKVSSLFPILTAEYATDIAIENITLDGNREANDHLNGNYAGCVWMQDCSRIVLRGVTARNYNGDGISWQICHDVLVEGCHSHDNADLGLHPGSGSQRPVIVGNTCERNEIGLFFCWGVKYGLAEKNVIRESRGQGISIGHRDDENLVRDNDVIDSGKAGVLFRPERGEGFTARGNRVEGNRIVGVMEEDGAGIDVQGVTSGNFIARNAVRQTEDGRGRVGIRLGEQSGENSLADNRVEGFPIPVEDRRKSS